MNTLLEETEELLMKERQQNNAIEKFLENIDK